MNSKQKLLAIIFILQLIFVAILNSENVQVLALDGEVKSFSHRETLQEKLRRISNEKLSELESKQEQTQLVPQKLPSTTADKKEDAKSEPEKVVSLVEIEVGQENLQVQKSADKGEKNGKDEISKTLESEISKPKESSSVDEEKLQKAFADSQKLYIFATENLSINVVCKNSYLGRQVLGLAQKLENVSKMFFPEEIMSTFKQSDAPLPRVELHILYTEDVKAKSEFKELKTRFGGRQIIVKFTPKTSIETLCEKLLNAHLHCIATSINLKRGNLSEQKIPYWLSLAIKTAYARELSLGLVHKIVSYSEKNPPATFAEVIEFKPEANANIYAQELSSYWTLLALKSVMTKGSFENFIILSVLEKTPQKLISKGATLSLMSEEAFLDTMQMAQFSEILSRTGGVKNFAQSEAEILRLSSVLKQRTGEPMMAIPAIAIYPVVEKLKGEISTRIEEIKYNLTWMNPAYINVLISLGQLYEAALEQDFALFEKSKNSFAEELKRAREIAKLSNTILNSQPKKE